MLPSLRTTALRSSLSLLHTHNTTPYPHPCGCNHECAHKIHTDARARKHASLCRQANTDTQRVIHMNSHPPARHSHASKTHPGKETPTCLFTLQPLSPIITGTVMQAYVPPFTPAPAPNRHPDTHHIKAPPHPHPAACPQLHAGISASEKSPTRAAAPPPLPLSGAQFSAKRIWAPSPLPAPCGQR